MVRPIENDYDWYILHEGTADFYDYFSICDDNGLSVDDPVDNMLNCSGDKYVWVLLYRVLW